MVSRLGFDTEDDGELLRHALQVTDTYKPMVEALTWQAQDGSELARLDTLIGSNITLTDTFVVGQRTAVGCVLHLAELFKQGFEPRASVAVSLSRTALVSSSHLIYVLGPADPVVRVAHARQVLRRQAGSHVSAVREFARFDRLSGLRAPSALVADLEESREVIAGASKAEGAMVLDIADSLAQVLVDAGYNDEDELVALREHLAWMWHVWSGVAHGWAWPKFIPGLDDADHDVAPGHWATDFFHLTTLVQQAVRLLADGLVSAT